VSGWPAGDRNRESGGQVIFKAEISFQVFVEIISSPT